MAEIRRSGTWGSALTADEFTAIKSVGFEPVGQVLGAAVYNIGYTGGYACPGAWAGFGGFASPYRSVTSVSGTGATGSFGPMVQALYHRDREGVGQEVSTSIVNAQLLHTSYAWIHTGGAPSDWLHADGNQYGLSPFYRLYQCADDGWLMLANPAAATTPKTAAHLAPILRRPAAAAAGR